MDYQNWLKVGLALQLTTKALTPFCKDEMVSLHTSLKTSIGSSVTCPGCTIDDLKKRNFTCPNNVCHQWFAGIKAQSAEQKFCWKNSKVSWWPDHPWQIAQCHMGLGRDDGNTNPLQTDPEGILQLIINCKHFHSLIDIDKVKEVITRGFFCHKTVIFV